MALSQPQRLLKLLPELHPSVDMALNTALRLTCPVGGVKIVAELPDAADGSVDGGSEVDAAACASLDAMWAQLPPEAGGSLRGLQTMLTEEMLLTGMAAAELVPGPPLAGVRRIWPVDTLTLEFWRPDRESDLELRQRQLWPQAKRSKPAWQWGWQALPSDRVKWRSLEPRVDNPHGRAPYASALNEALADLALMQDLRDAVHNAAWPRLEVGVNLAELHRTAVEVYRIGNPKAAADWVKERWQSVVDYVAGLRSDDNVVHDSTGSVKNLQPGSFQGVEGVLSFLRQRVAQSLKTLPTLLGINDGSTFNYTSVEWAIYAQGLETLRSIVAELLVEIANAHLRLIGSRSIARAVLEPIRTNDAQVEANTESTRITNATNKEKLGYLTHDQASMEVVGRKAAAKAQPGVIEPLIPQTPAGGVVGTRKQGKPGPKNIPQNPNNEGTTKEQRNAEKARPK